jgi:glucosamine 6-phosphate synthetase-like amidotransferase/phosphosugar isomerase protein
MCAVFGSANISTFEVLYDANKERGNFASSAVSLTTDDQLIMKVEGDINFDKVKIDHFNTKYFTGHVQAPTSAKRDWTWDTSHPFDSLSWMVFHNGVLTNAPELEQWCRPSWSNPVDTAIIPELLQHTMESCKYKKPRPVYYIKQVLEMLEGTFALSIIDCDTNEVYLARSGSILHYNSKGDYSTLPGKGYREVPEGVILRLNTETKRFNKVGSFKTKSPFLFI